MNDSLFKLTENIFIEFSYSDELEESRIDIRRWYKDRKSGMMLRSRKGINLSVDEWDTLVESWDELREFMDAFSFAQGLVDINKAP